MDDVIRIYLLELRNMPLLTAEEERAAIRQIRTTRMRFRRHALACEFVLRGAIDSIGAACEGREPFHQVVEESAAICSDERARVHKELAGMLAVAEGLLRRDADEDQAIRDPRTGLCRRGAAGRRRLGRWEVVRLLAESPLRTECLRGSFDQLCDIHGRVGRIAGGLQTALPGELADLLGRLGEMPATLARRIGKAKASRQAHDAAKHALLCGNLRLVFSIAKRYCHRGLSLLDLVQEGSLGLMQAVDKVSCLFHCPFSHYAATWITQMIRRALGHHAGPITMPPYAVQAVARMRAVASRLSQDGRHQPNPDELAEATGLPPKKLFNLLQLQRQPLRLSCCGDEADDDPEAVNARLLADPWQPSAVPEARQEELHERIEDALRVLPDKQQAVIRLRFGLADRRARTLREIGQTLSLTKERIRQLEHDALDRLRTAEVGRRLADFLPGDALCSAATDGAVGA